MNEAQKSQSVVNVPTRYRSLILFITAFVTIIVGVLILNFSISAQLSIDAQEINVAGRQRMLSQRIAKSLQNMILSQQNQNDYQPLKEELRNAYNLFDSTLTAFDEGNTITAPDGTLMNIRAVDESRARKAVNEAKIYWNEYRNAIDSLLKAQSDAPKQLSIAIEKTISQNIQLLNLMNQLTEVLTVTDSRADLINISGRQRMLSQQISKSLLEIVNAQSRNGDINASLNELNASTKLFEQTLNAFLSGGMVINTDGSLLKVSAFQDNNIRSILNESRALWQDMYTSLRKVTANDALYLQKLSKTQNYATTNNLELLRTMNDLTSALETESNDRTDFLKKIQIFGILLALAMFSLIIFIFLKKLIKADSDLIHSQQETDRILKTVKDGLFLMDSNHNISNQHSQSLKSIINEEQPGGKNFLEILKKIVPEKTLNLAEDYLDLLLGDRVNADLMGDLNPLDQIEVYYKTKGIDRRVGHLGFKFSQVKSDGQSHLLVQVDDITEKVKLEQELKKSQEQAKAQFDLMLKVLHVEPQMLAVFLRGAEKSLNDINDVLQQRTSGEKANRDKLNLIFLHMHRLKGDAGALGLEVFESKAHDFENLLEEIRTKSKITGKDFLPLTIRLDDFLNQVDSLESLIHKLSELQKTFNEEIDIKNSPKLVNECAEFRKKLISLTQKVANDEGKRVALNTHDEHLIPSEKHQEIYDILTQLIRNSIVHGIESQDIRSQMSKSSQGRLDICVRKNPMGEVLISYRDDGQGLPVEKIKHQAIKKGIISQPQSESLTDKQITDLIFKPGFSTVDRATKNAGRGVGMELIINQLKKIGGKFSIKSIEGKSFQFMFKV